VLGLVANLACMGAYIFLPWQGYGTPHEPLLALGIAAVWALYGGFYFLTSGKSTGRKVLLESRSPTA